MRSRILGLILLAFAPGFLTALAGAATTELPDEMLKERDPFKMPQIETESVSRSELEQYPVEKFKLIGVLSGPTGLRAMIAAPNGKTYFVKKGLAIGIHKGAIYRITETAVIVREKLPNVLGKIENTDFEIKLPSDSKQDVKMTTFEQGW